MRSGHSFIYAQQLLVRNVNLVSPALDDLCCTFSVVGGNSPLLGRCSACNPRRDPNNTQHKQSFHLHLFTWFRTYAKVGTTEPPTPSAAE